MTKEEIIQAISDDETMPFIQPEQLAQIVAFVINNYQPSLPSDIDEAELKYVESMDNPPANQEEERIIYQTFKAGAEWMAGQGWSRELEVEEDAGGYPYIDKHIELYDYDTDTPLAKKGDKVVVHIRKK